MADPKVFASSVDLKYCYITPNKEGSKPFDATQGVLRFDYFEDIESPTIFASLVIGEESMNSMISEIPLQGAESVQIRLKTAVDDTEHTYQFRIYKIFARYVTDRFQTYTLGLISQEALSNEMVRMGMVLKGLPSEIVLKLLKENLNTQKDVMVDTAVNKMKLFPGKKTPFSIIETLKMKSIAQEGGSTVTVKANTSLSSDKKVQTGGISAVKEHEKQAKGSAGYLFWENKAGYNFRAMDKLYDEKTNAPVATYQQQNTQLANDPRFVISNVEFEKEIDLLDKLRHGAYSSVICFYNYSTGSYEEYGYSLDEQFKEMNHLGPQSGVTASQGTFSEFPTRIMSVLLDHETWHNTEEVASPEDKDGGNKNTAEYPDWQKSYTAQSIARFNTFNNQQLEIKVPGNPSLKVGDTIDIKIMNQQSNKNKPGQAYDPEHSGVYLISKLNHAFVPKQPITETFLTVIRDVYGDKTTEVETTS
mgnify:CR=1 FL=1|tara:strand:- start:3389 stop:4813 length:1425 start_codon:yes stop_codon:yes gene_type:complete